MFRAFALPPSYCGKLRFFYYHCLLQVGSGFKFAYIVFEKPAGVRNSMNKMPLNTVRVASTPEKPILGKLIKI
jgi:hypothetical protein